MPLCWALLLPWVSLATASEKSSSLSQLFPDINPSSRDAKEMLVAYKKQCRMQELMAQNRDVSAKLLLFPSGWLEKREGGGFYSSYFQFQHRQELFEKARGCLVVSVSDGEYSVHAFWLAQASVAPPTYSGS